MVEVELWPIIAMSAFWSLAFPALYYAYQWFLDTFCVALPLECVRIPKELPHPDPPGESLDFPVRLLSATTAELEAFMKFRGRCDELKGLRGGESQERALRRVAEEAAKYKGELVDVKHCNWDYDHFELRKKGLAFPVGNESPPRSTAVAPRDSLCAAAFGQVLSVHWNGWRGWWAEIGPRRKRMIVGHLVLATEHFVFGFIIPCWYLYGEQMGLPYGGDSRRFVLALVGDMGANVVDSVSTAASYFVGSNVSLLQLTRPIWPLELAHHISAIGMCYVGLLLGDEYKRPMDLGCLLLISLLGTTGCFHLLVVPLTYSPVNDQPRVGFVVQTIVVASMLWFRVVYWVVLCQQLVAEVVSEGGMLVGGGCVAALLLFTLFNIDFVKYHLKVERTVYRRMMASQGAKKD